MPLASNAFQVLTMLLFGDEREKLGREQLRQHEYEGAAHCLSDVRAAAE